MSIYKRLSHSLRAGALLALVLIGAGLAGVSGSTPSAQAFTATNVQTVPGLQGNLKSIGCLTSGAACFAVGGNKVIPIVNGVPGASQGPSSFDPIYGIHGNPLTWDVAEFTGIACPDNSFCVAVGWAFVNDPQDPVVCNNGQCSGTKLHVGVVVAITAAQAVAPVGNGQFVGPAHVVRYHPTFNNNDQTSLYAVACATATQCVGVGHGGVLGYNGFIDGVSVPITRTGAPGTPKAASTTLLAIACESATHCYARGWASHDINPADGSVGPPMSNPVVPLIGVGCNAACYAVGGRSGSSIIGLPANVELANTGTPLNGITCPSAGRCLAVGGSSTGAVATYTGSPSPAVQTIAAAPALKAIACVSSTLCYAVGGDKLVTLSEPEYGVSWMADTTPSTMAGGATQNIGLSFINTGSLAWAAGGPNPVRVSYHWRSGACPGSGTAVSEGLRTNLPADVPSGGSVTSLAAQVQAPASPGTYCLQFDLVREGITWFSSQDADVLAKTVSVNINTATPAPPSPSPANPDGAWAIGTVATTGGYIINRWTGAAWETVPGGAVSIAIGPDGEPWIVNDAGHTFRRVNGAWQDIPGFARDIAVGADGSVWKVGTDPVPGGYGVYQYAGGGWVQVPGGAVRIAVGPDGEPWVVNDAGRTLRRVSGAWQDIPGFASDIDVGADGSVWKIGTDLILGGYGVSQYTGSGWAQVPGGAVRISVGADGQPWIVNNAGTAYRRLNGGWQPMPGTAREIDVR
jgi:hypothetical protein